MSRWTKAGGLVLGAVFAVATSLVASIGEAAVVREGTWPDADPTVSLELGRISRGDALRKLADEAGWSLVFDVEVALESSVVVHLRDVSASRALDAILASGDWTASRDGSLVRIAPRRVAEGAATPPLAPAPPPATRRSPPAPPPTPAEITKPGAKPARDVTVTGESVRIVAGDTVRDVTVLGGTADIEGRVTGDLAVIGGSARIHAGAHVERDANAIGGSITIDEGARVDGEISVIGGVVHGGEHARGRGVTVVGGQGDEARSDGSDGLLARANRALSSAISSAALLFVFGAVLIALAGGRFDQLRSEIAARPVKSLATGLVGGIGSLIAMVVLCVTVIGIPFAAVGLLLFLVAVFAGTAAAATTAGAALTAHRIRSPYGHLAVGCAVYLVAGLLPWVGGWIQVALLLAGFGAIVSTRAAGLIRRKPALPPATPYR